MPATYAVLNRILNFELRGVAYTPPATFYAGYSVTEPIPDGTGVTEPGNGYDRFPVPKETASWTPPSTGIASCLLEVLFPQPTGVQVEEGQTIYACLWDSATVGTGELQYYQAVVVSRPIDESSIPVKFRIGDLRVKFPTS